MNLNDSKFLKETKDLYDAAGEVTLESLQESQEKTEKNIKNYQDRLLRLERQYREEKSELDDAYSAAEEEKYQRDYEIRLAKAKTKEQAETIRVNEDLRKQKKANQEQLDALRDRIADEKELLQEKIESEKKLLKEMEAERKRLEREEKARLKKQREEITKSFDEIAKRVLDSVGELDKARREMAEKMTDYGGLYREHSTYFFNSGPDGTPELFEDVIPDLSKKREELSQYASLLAQIRQKHTIPTALFEDIRALSIEDAIRFQEALLALDEEDLSDYIEDYTFIDQLAKETANVNYADETRAVLREVEQALSGWYGSLPEDFFNEGALSAEGFSEGFMEKIATLQGSLRESLLSLLPAKAGAMIFSGGGADSYAVNQIQNATTYVFKSAGETVAEQLQTARAHDAITRLRGVEG